MATQNNNKSKLQREPKFLLAKWYTDAEITVEPEETGKVVVAGMTEALVKKEYPDAFFKRAFAVLRGEFAHMLKSTIWFLLATVLFIVGLAVGRHFLEGHLLGGNYNFMAGIGVGYPGGGDSIDASVSVLFGKVFQYVLLILAGAMIIASPFMAGQFYVAKRLYFQDVYKYCNRTFFYGFKKHWWKYLLLGTIVTVLLLGVGSAILQLVALQQIGMATAGYYCAVIIPAIVAFPIILICFAMMGLTVSYELTFKQSFKNAIVLIANNLIFVPVTGALTLLPILFFCTGSMGSIIAYVVMVLGGFNLIALAWVAMADRGMVKCKSLRNYFAKKQLAEVRKATKAYQESQAKAKKVQSKQAYQNPKKKKKK